MRRCDPSGVALHERCSWSGGVAAEAAPPALNHRLIAATPPGSNQASPSAMPVLQSFLCAGLKLQGRRPGVPNTFQDMVKLAGRANRDGDSQVRNALGIGAVILGLAAVGERGDDHEANAALS